MCLDTSSYLTVLHSLAEEAVQQQVLQLAVSVERLFDLTQEDAMEEGGDKCSSGISTMEGGSLPSMLFKPPQVGLSNRIFPTFSLPHFTFSLIHTTVSEFVTFLIQRRDKKGKK